MNEQKYIIGNLRDQIIFMTDGIGNLKTFVDVGVFEYFVNNNL